MKVIVLQYNFTDDLGLTSIDIVENETGQESDNLLLERLALATIKALIMNEDDINFQAEIQKLGITTKRES